VTKYRERKAAESAHKIFY